MEYVPCRYLDYEPHYDAELRTAAPDFPHVRYWHRTKVPFEGAPRNVQFCRKRGRIAGIFQCYTGELECYEPVENEEGGMKNDQGDKVYLKL